MYKCVVLLTSLDVQVFSIDNLIDVQLCNISNLTGCTNV